MAGEHAYIICSSRLLWVAGLALPRGTNCSCSSSLLRAEQLPKLWAGSWPLQTDLHYFKLPRTWHHWDQCLSWLMPPSRSDPNWCFFSQNVAVGSMFSEWAQLHHSAGTSLMFQKCWFIRHEVGWIVLWLLEFSHFISAWHWRETLALHLVISSKGSFRGAYTNTAWMRVAFEWELVLLVHVR